MKKFAWIALLTALPVLGVAPVEAANVNIDGLPAAASVAGTDLLECEQGLTNRKCTAAQAGAYVYSLMSGDATASGAGAVTFATVNANVGSFGSATQCVAHTVNAKGLITATSAVTCTPAVGSITGMGTGVITALGINAGTAGSIVVNGGALGTPSSGTLTNATGLPISTGVSGLAAGIATFLATPSSANLAAALTDETGSGASVFGTAPTISSLNATTAMTLAWITGSTQCLQVNSSGVVSGTGSACGAGGGGSSVTTASGVSSTVAAMTAGSALDGTELYYAVQGGNDRKITGAQIKTLANTSAVRATTTTSEALANSDQGKLVTFSNASSVAASIGQAGSGGNFAAGWVASLKNLGAGTVTLTPTTSTVDGAATVTLTTGQGLDLYSDGANYFTQAGKGTGSAASGANPTATASDTAVNGVASTFMRSDAAPAVQKASNSQFGLVEGDGTTVSIASGVASSNGGIPPAYAANNWYIPPGITVTAASASLGASSIKCYYGVVNSPIHVTTLGANVTTSAAATNIQLAVYSNSNGRPGTLIANTASIATTANGVVTGSITNTALGPGSSAGSALWWCTNQDSSSTAFTSIGSMTVAGLIGSATHANAFGVVLTGVSCTGAACNGGSSTFNTWPASLAGSTWSDITTARTPLVSFQVNTVP